MNRFRLPFSGILVPTRNFSIIKTPFYRKWVRRPEVVVGEDGKSTLISRIPHVKHKTPVKRASKLLNILKTEEFIKLKQGREWEDIRAGDAVEVEKLAYITAPVADKFRGLVISKTNRGSDSAITIINSEYGTNIVRDVVLYSPLIQNIRILQKAFIHKGKKRVRRSKLYYMLDRDPEEYTIK